MPIPSSLLSSLLPSAALYAAYKSLSFVLLYAHPWATADPALTWYLHATKGKPAWALVAIAVTDHPANLSRATAFELAGRGFNVVLYGVGANAAKLKALRTELAARHPENKYRLVIADGDAGTVESSAGMREQEQEQGQEGDDFVARVVRSLRDVNLTVLVTGSDTNNATTAIPTHLITALIPLLSRSTPAIIINLVHTTPSPLVSPFHLPSSPAPSSSPSSSIPPHPSSPPNTPPACHICGATPLPFQSLLPNPQTGYGIDVVTYLVGPIASTDHAATLWQPKPEVVAKAVLGRASSRSRFGGERGRRPGAVYAYWPHAVAQVTQAVQQARVRVWGLDLGLDSDTCRRGLGWLGSIWKGDGWRGDGKGGVGERERV
ncbi:hypothetical protein GGR54DRAFT_506717 [Hypoxylon sp. NC1633]|nr:hypothetical protein GGR54DRAFT_506717 [Hypoxylon sp. NC1633]